MAHLLHSLIIMVWPWLSQACMSLSVDQKPRLLVTLSGRTSSVNCDITMSITSPQVEVISSVFHQDAPGTLLDTRSVILSNSSTSWSVQHNITGSGPSAVYYCRVTCGKRSANGSGTYVHVRDSGYVEPTSTSQKLCCGLIALCVLLFLLSGAGTFLVVPFFWKRQQKPSTRAREFATAGQTANAQASDGDTAGSLYTSLEPRSDDVYDVLEEDPSKPKDLKHHAEVHSVVNQSPVRRPKPQVKTPSIHEKAQGGGTGKPHQRHKPKRVISDQSLYENIKH
ncbi:NFAT activation molecule 1 isoform X2 [Mixophyes fleayi]|uniref:NFAT activation molecule 1 isoform X2 n=1 Tax=Mixophyes fleayi TaxID=3061075 RepID=UPI003F4DFC02